MKKLTHENFMKAREYIFSSSDDINHAWFRYNFENSDTDAFMHVLAKYQHDNGGFGGIYYEFDYQGPCLKSTEIAIKYILKLKVKPSAAHPVIQKMMNYILERYHPEIGNWGDPAVPEVNDGVYNHWVRYRGDPIIPIASVDERIEKYDANEKVCFAAFVALYSELVPEELYRDIIKYPIEYIFRYYDENSPDYRRDIFDEGVPYDFEYFQWFVPCLKDNDTAYKLISILRQNPTAFMELDFSKSDYEYVHLPCDAIDSPDNIIYPAVKDLVDDSLEFRIKQQSNDGRWPLGWTFGEDEGLRKLQTLYEAHRTMLILAALGRFGRIEI
ncbi:MAG: hypothetical protein HDR14_06110 [Lachnospiraceae bacterium]|nr:hypothetical protein [Lachnospiraceae bacterium]